MVQINSLYAVKGSKTFGQTVNGEVNRIVRAVWRNGSDDDDSLVLVGERANYMGNFHLPQKYPLTEAGINDYANVLRAKLKDGALKMNGFTFSVSELTNGEHKAFRNIVNGHISRSMDRAFKEGMSETGAFQFMKDDLMRAATKTNKTIEWVDE